MLSFYTKRQIQEIVDMPDKLIDLFVKFACQSHGLIGEQKKAKYFDMLTKEEVETMQEIVQINMLNVGLKDKL